MKIIETSCIVDAVACRVGQPATLVRIESDEDLHALLGNILAAGYYNTDYFERQTGFHGDLLTMNLWFVTSMIRALDPRRSIEIGAGKGDVVEMLRRAGIDAWGIDFSDDMYDQLSPVIRDAFYFGDALEISRNLAKAGDRFDTIVGLDIWEHLLPDDTIETVRATTDLMTDDGMCISIIPAFGHDPVFGEVFPLEFEENRARFDAGQPFDHLTLESVDPPIPAAGHLIWAPAVWWSAQFTDAGLVREPQIERRLHDVFDPFLPPSNRSFFVFRRDTPAAAARAKRVRRRLRRPAPAQRGADLARLAATQRAGTHTFAVPPFDYVADRNRVAALGRAAARTARRGRARLFPNR